MYPLTGLLENRESTTIHKGMPKSRKRKQPVTSTTFDRTHKTPSGHNLIRQFHILLKRRKHLAAGTSSTSQELLDIENEITQLGGLETYQRISAQGQSEERGGGSHKVFIEWMLEKDLKKKWEDKQNKFR
jgi:25S rRNA (adenine2142-N1)-methyltransferase